MASGLGAAVLAGALNSVAGGGSFISFPALVFLGLPSIVANATNNTAMWLGTLSSVGGYREELSGWRGLWPALVVSLVGGVIGAELLLRTPEQTFSQLIPWLLLFATLVFAGSDALRTLAGRPAASEDRIELRWLPALFVVAIYGGYFGAGIGILILALFAVSGWTHIHRMNAAKVLLATSVNGIAVIPFLLAHKIAWREALIFTVGAVVGGYVGARIARRIDPRIVRLAVVIVGVGMTVYFFVRRA
ncbi:MAG: sulfite exporter TauE/SafE family protein [Candidatus Eremiobacteraeota bacterium]|nr:sulfite exporter TauE/SafE family protein [Candidatus Eremiobacteraeota bacterium]